METPASLLGALKGMDVARFVSEDVASTEAWRAVMSRIGKAPSVAALAAALKRDVARAAKAANAAKAHARA